RIIVLEGATLIVNADVTLPIHAYGTVIVEKGKRVKETVYAKQFKSGSKRSIFLNCDGLTINLDCFSAR
ncbi:hypothetical protein ACW7EJ_00180, partial [Acinetobacter soli]